MSHVRLFLNLTFSLPNVPTQLPRLINGKFGMIPGYYDFLKCVILTKICIVMPTDFPLLLKPVGGTNSPVIAAFCSAFPRQ